MRVKITVSSIKRKYTSPVTYSTPVDMHVEGDNLEFFANGASTPLLVVHDKNTGTQYVTDFAYSSALTALEAAADDSGAFLLT